MSFPTDRSRGTNAGLLAGALLLTLACAAPAQESASGKPAASPEVSMVGVTGEAARWWPRWRGPSGQGLVSGDGYPDTWSGTDGVLWKVRVPGRGGSSPIVWADRVFLTTAHRDGQTRSVLSYRRSDGHLLWEVAAPAAPPEAAHAKNTHASSTPASDGERVYAYFGNSGLVAVDFGGEQVWHQDLGRFNAFHGTASSPLLYRGKVVVAQDHRGAGGSFIAAFDAKTGAPLWRTRRQAQVGWNTPVAVRVGERELIVLSSQQKVTAYDPETGEEVWSVGGNTFEAIPTPVVGHDLIFCSSGRAGPTLAIRPAADGGSAEVVWKSPKGSPFVPSPVVYGDLLYMVNDMASIATAFDAASGEVAWQGRLGTARKEGFSASPVAVGGKIYFTNDEGETFVLKAGGEFEILRVNDLGERVLASPALVDGRWYFRTERHLLAIGAS